MEKNYKHLLQDRLTYYLDWKADWQDWFKQQEINESLNDPLLTEVIADNKFRSTLRRIVNGAFSRSQYVTDPGRVYAQLKQRFRNRSLAEYANAIFSVAEFGATTLAILSAADPKSFENELPNYYLYGVSDTSLLERKARKVFIELAQRQGEKALARGGGDHVIYLALNIQINKL